MLQWDMFMSSVHNIIGILQLLLNKFLFNCLIKLCIVNVMYIIFGCSIE